LTVVSTATSAETTFTLDDLLAMDQVEVDTENEFVDGRKIFSGPLVRAVLERIGGQNSERVRLTAANDYQVEVPTHEFFDYDAILSLSVDGVPHSKREKGPIWVIYPMSDFAELRDPVYNSRLIWQLVKMEYQ